MEQEYKIDRVLVLSKQMDYTIFKAIATYLNEVKHTTNHLTFLWMLIEKILHNIETDFLSQRVYREIRKQMEHKS